jgi:hypothetical protein
MSICRHGTATPVFQALTKGRLERVRAPVKNVLGTHSKGGQAKNLHATSESPSFAEGLGLGLKGLICAIDR